MWWRQLYLAWTRYVHHAWMSIRLPPRTTLFPYTTLFRSAEIPGPPMPKYSVCGVNIWTWPGQGMGTIYGCLFLFLQTIFADSGHIFPFLAEILGHTMPKFTICGGDSFTWLGQGMYIMLGCLYVYPRELLSFPTRLSSDLQRSQGPPCPNILYVV